MITRRQHIRGIIALLLTAMIWGLAFAAQRTGMDHMEPSAFNAIRSFIGAFALLPVIVVLDRMSGRRITFFGAASSDPAAKKHLLTGGLLCGLSMAAASLLQQAGLVTVKAGSGAFLTALYIVIVPLLGIFAHKKTTRLMWCAVVLALGGTVLLCSKSLSSGFSLSVGELLLIGCALMYSLQILAIDKYAPAADCVRMACIQFLVVGVISTAASLILGDSWAWSNVRPALVALLYCGIGSSGIAYTLQMIGQKYVHPTAASLLMSLESVFGVIGGGIFLREVLSPLELAGCAVIFAAVILAQIPSKTAKGAEEKSS